MHASCFPSQWHCANIVPIPKGPISSLLSGIRPISITPVLSKIFERMVSSSLDSYMEREGIYPGQQYAYRVGLETCVDLLDIACAIGELAMVQIDFSAAVDHFNHVRLLFKL